MHWDLGVLNTGQPRKFHYPQFQRDVAAASHAGRGGLLGAGCMVELWFGLVPFPLFSGPGLQGTGYLGAVGDDMILDTEDEPMSLCF